MKKNGRLKILRILNGFSQDALGEKLNVPQATISFWENGKYAPSADSFSKLSYALSTSSKYLTSGFPPIDSAVWMPFSPSRSDFLLAMQRDINLLFPQLIEENGFNAMYTDSLSDGGRFFLFGRNYFFGCLLLADSQLARSFYDSSREIIRDNSIIEFDHKFDIFDDRIFHSIPSEWRFSPGYPSHELHVDIQSISQLLAFKRENAQKNNMTILRSESLRLVYRTFNEVVRQYDLVDSVMNDLDELFLQKYNELSQVPPNRINVFLLTSEIRKTLESHGCPKKTTI